MLVLATIRYIILDYSKLIFSQTLPKRIWVTGKWFPKMPKCRAVFPFTLVSLIFIKFEKFNKIFFKFSLCPYKQECQSQIRSTLGSDVSFWLFLIDFVDPDFTVLAFLGLDSVQYLNFKLGIQTKVGD